MSQRNKFLKYTKNGHLQFETFHYKLQPNRCRWGHG